MPWDPVLKFFLLKKVFASPVNSVQDPLFFNKMQEHTFFVHSKHTLSLLLTLLFYLLLSICHINKYEKFCQIFFVYKISKKRKNSS